MQAYVQVTLRVGKSLLWGTDLSGYNDHIHRHIHGHIHASTTKTAFSYYLKIPVLFLEHRKVGWSLELMQTWRKELGWYNPYMPGMLVCIMCTSIFEFIIWEITQNQTNFFHFHKKAKTGQARIYDVTYCIVWKVIIPHPKASPLGIMYF